MEEAAPAAAASSAAAKPFLRRGAGLEARMAAAREGRRYMPRGGAVKDYSQEGEAPLPARRRAAQAAAAARPKLAAARPGRSAPPSAAASPARPRPAVRPLPAEAAPTTAPAAPADWARRLLQRQGGPQAAAVTAPAAQAPQRCARQADEVAALQEFEALESQVLREVHTNSSLPRGSGGKKLPGSGGGGAPPQQPCAGPSAQQEWAAPPVLGAAQDAPEPENWDAAPQADDDVFASDGEGGVCGLFGESSQTQAAAAGVAHPLACRAVTFGAGSVPSAQLGAAQRRWPPPVYCDEEDEGELQAESSFQGVPSQPASTLVQQYFSRPPAPAAPAEPHAAARTVHQPAAGQLAAQRLPGDAQQTSAAEAEALEQLQQEVVALQQERARVARMRLELEEATGRLEQEKAAFEKRKVEDAARFEAERSEELRKLQRDRRVLEKQSRAIMKMPTKQSKEEVAAVEALLAEERRAARAREARHKLAMERLRQQLVELQAKNSELREQVLCLEQQRLAAAWGEVAAGAPSSSGAIPAAAAAAAAAAAGEPAGGQRQSSGSQSTAAGRSVAPLQPPAAGRPGRPGSLPAVRVERGSGRACSAPAADLRSGLQQQGRTQTLSFGPVPVAGTAAAGVAAVEEAIADVELCDAEEIVVWCKVQDGQQPAADEWAAADDGPGLLDAAAASAAAGLSAPAGGAMEVQQSWLPGSTEAARSPTGPPIFAATDAMSKASSALARFNQLRSSLAQHDSLQGRLASSIASLQPSPPSVPSAVATPPPVDGAAVAPSAAAPSCGPQDATAQQDDLRRLGHSLLAAAAPSSAPAAAAALSGAPVSLLAPSAVAQKPTDAPQAVQHAPAASAPPTSGTAADAVVSEVQHPDGRWERLFASGAREQRFANGSAKRSLPGGASLTRFANGDMKKMLPGGTVEYYFAEVASWQVTHPSGVDVFFFPSGQVEAHHPGGVKEVLFPDGAVRKLLPDGRELAISTAHLSREIQAAQPVAALE